MSVLWPQCSPFFTFLLHSCLDSSAPLLPHHPPSPLLLHAPFQPSSLLLLLLLLRRHLGILLVILVSISFPQESFIKESCCDWNSIQPFVFLWHMQIWCTPLNTVSIVLIAQKPKRLATKASPLYNSQILLLSQHSRFVNFLFPIPAFTAVMAMLQGKQYKFNCGLWEMTIASRTTLFRASRGTLQSWNESHSKMPHLTSSR